eukprot:scaffold6852_cov215-Ochromonas_danica.AAC.7
MQSMHSHATKMTNLAMSAGTTTTTTTTGNKKKVLVLGGDGFCGWPTSLYLSEQGHDVIIADNLSRQQRAAPYSMKDARRKRYTIDNNVSGTMGVYGYGTSGGEIPEGYLDVILPGGRPSKILHPANPGSVYHLTKCLDALTFQYYNKNDGLRVTDLHQGIVWGTNTKQTIRDERLINRFDYDGDYGTVLNRFLMQAALDIPLTVYGTGGQTRAFIHITDTARCIELAINNPPKTGDKVEIFNQVAETLRVGELAKLISEKTGCQVRHLENPRKEDAENELEVANRKFCNLGLNPITLDLGLLDEVVNIAGKYRGRCDRSKVLPSSFWNKARADAAKSDSARVEEKAN